MSSGYWQTKRQKEQFPPGKTLTQKVKTYIQTWVDRCYENGIPDHAPKKLSKSGRVPSWEMIAIAILNNDHNLYSLGFSQRESVVLNAIIEEAKKRNGVDTQKDMFKE